MSAEKTAQRELFNQEVKKNTAEEVYFTALLEQWKTANELTANVLSFESQIPTQKNPGNINRFPGRWRM